MRGWSLFEKEAREACRGKGAFSVRAYSEYMPPPYVGIKPYLPTRAEGACTARASDDGSLDVSEYEQAEELTPGLAHVAATVLGQIAKLATGTTHLLSRTLVVDNPAWPAELTDAAKAGRFARGTFTIALSLALSRTQDDKGNVRWTLFGCSHEGPSRAFWASFRDDEGARFAHLMAWMAGRPGRVRIFAEAGERLPAFAEALRLNEGDAIEHVGAVFTFVPFARLPEAVREAYLQRRMEILPSPASQLFFQHPYYARLAKGLPYAAQIPLLHVFPRVEGAYSLRIPQSGWLDEHATEGFSGGHRVVSKVVRTHRWQRAERDLGVATLEAFADDVSVALFSTTAEDIGLYGKPMARNAQVWTDDYEPLLHGPGAARADLERAAARLHAKKARFGYRFFFPPMEAGPRSLFWHLPLVARMLPGRRVEVLPASQLVGIVTAERPGAESVTLVPRLLARPVHVGAATLFPRDPGLARNTQGHNARKLLDFAELLGEPVPATMARALMQAPRHATMDDVFAHLLTIGEEPKATLALVDALRACVAPDGPPGEAIVFGETASRTNEEWLFRIIADLSEGRFPGRDNADPIPGNAGKTGGPAAKAVRVAHARQNDLDTVGRHLAKRHAEEIEKSGMTGRAEVLTHDFHWETDFELSWSGGWSRSQPGHGAEKNVVVRIPGKRRDQAVIMADHYDTAYMEDVYETDRGGDGLRAAAQGADDNASGTAALLLAARTLLPLAREGKLERDVWLVHLTGEEFPSDCMGARALASALVERSLVLTGRDGPVDVSETVVTGAVILDMVAHNNPRDRDAFLLCPGEGSASARLARLAHLANVKWNRFAVEANLREARRGRGRALRMPDGTAPPPLFEHLPVFGRVATEWEPRSVLYNTDGQIFSDLGVPVLLFMEAYDINRSGYHDTHDTMKNIDLDYASALISIAIETVAQAARAASPEPVAPAQ